MIQNLDVVVPSSRIHIILKTPCLLIPLWEVESGDERDSAFWSPAGRSDKGGASQPSSQNTTQLQDKVWVQPAGLDGQVQKRRHKFRIRRKKRDNMPISGLANPQVSRFCWQYLQLESAPELPDGEVLRDEEAQEAIYKRLFADDAIAVPPPRRYQLRILKELIARVESAILNWDQHVSKRTHSLDSLEVVPG